MNVKIMVQKFEINYPGYNGRMFAQVSETQELAMWADRVLYDDWNFVSPEAFPKGRYIKVGYGSELPEGEWEELGEFELILD